MNSLARLAFTAKGTSLGIRRRQAVASAVPGSHRLPPGDGARNPEASGLGRIA